MIVGPKGSGKSSPVHDSRFEGIAGCLRDYLEVVCLASGYVCLGASTCKILPVRQMMDSLIKRLCGYSALTDLSNADKVNDRRI